MTKDLDETLFDELFDVDNVYITLMPDNVKKVFPTGTSIREVLNGIEGCVAAIMNNQIVQLSTPVYTNSTISPIMMTSPLSESPMNKTLSIVLNLAVERLFEGEVLQLQWEHRKRTTFWKLASKSPIDIGDVTKIKDKMMEIIKSNLPINICNMGLPEATKKFEKYPLTSQLITQYQMPMLKVLEVNEEFYELFTTPSSDSTGLCPKFELFPSNGGIFLVNIEGVNPCNISDLLPQEHFSSLLEKSLATQELNKINSVTSINDRLNKMMCVHNTKMITVSENAILNQLNMLSNYVQNKQAFGKLPRVIFISGPSSSSKTTSSNKISTYLRGCGYHPQSLPLDSFYLDIDEIRRMQKTDNPDLDTLTTLNIPRIHKVIRGLVRGHRVRVPKYNFKFGISEEGDVNCINEYVKSKSKVIETKDAVVGDDGLDIPDILPSKSLGILVVEGIHALNPAITCCIPEELQVRVFLEPISGTRVTDQSIVTSTMTRLLRRSVRDYLYRGCSIAKTLKLWPNVLKGEETWIYPNSERAHIVINTSVYYELACLRDYALCVLSDTNDDIDAESYSLILQCNRFLTWISGVSADIIPNTSVIMEFYPGGSIYNDED